MQIPSVVRATALVPVVALVALSASPALAADPVARASATALTLSVANNPASTGSYAVSNDGTAQSSTGSNQPAVSLLGNQNFVAAGTLAQDATTTVTNGDGSSAACSGLAGQGATLAAAGTGNCLAGGNALNLTPSQVDLDRLFNVTLVAGQGPTSLGGLLGTIPGAPTAQVISALQGVVDQAIAPLAGSAIVVGAGAIQSRCTSTPTTAEGFANIANAGAFIDLPAIPGQPAQRLNLLNFPADPPPNTQVVVQLDTVLNTIISALNTSIQSSAQGALAPVLGPLAPGLQAALQAIQAQLVTAVVGQVSSQLGPINENLLNVTLNKQTRTGANQISVTALELNVGPNVPQLGGRVLSAQIGTSNCGPNGRVVAPAVAASPKPTPTRKPDPKPTPETSTPQVPTSVPAGLADGPVQNAPLGPWALAGLGGLLAVSVAAGAGAYRRSQSRL